MCEIKKCYALKNEGSKILCLSCPVSKQLVHLWNPQSQSIKPKILNFVPFIRLILSNKSLPTASLASA